jgi:hypothetical protein
VKRRPNRDHDLALDRNGVISRWACELKLCESCCDGSGKRISKEGYHRLGNKFVGHCCIYPVDDSELQNREGVQENHLQHGIYGHKHWLHCAVFIVPTSKSIHIRIIAIHLEGPTNIKPSLQERSMQAQASKGQFGSYKMAERI